MSIGRPLLYKTKTVQRSTSMPLPLARKAEKAASVRGVSLSKWMVAAIGVALRLPRKLDDELERLDRRR